VTLLLSRRSVAALALCGIAVFVGSSAAFAQSHTVSIEGMSFSPATLHVKRGDMVMWVNKDLVPHTVTASDKSFDSRNIPAGGSWSRTATRKGTTAYVCAYHPTMKGTLIVD